MTNHPARIWATVNGGGTSLPSGAPYVQGGWEDRPDKPRAVEYVRADLVEALMAKASAIAGHNLFLDREYLSADLNSKLDELRATLAAINGGQKDE
ncbi:MAG: hypothetical protein Q4G36_08380 [Paracoccus sp. (in: a-proteobacteria)]|nr:hypothetical protein [Paracoccus sp. (in: a-proteobacteria)]